MFILLKAMLTEHGAHDLGTFIALTHVTAIVVFLESILTVHHAHDIWTGWLLHALTNLESQGKHLLLLSFIQTEANCHKLYHFEKLAYLTASFVFLEAMLTEHSAHLHAALIAFTDITVVFILLESMLTVHTAHDV